MMPSPLGWKNIAWRSGKSQFSLDAVPLVICNKPALDIEAEMKGKDRHGKKYILRAF